MILITGRSANINATRSYDAYLYWGSRNGITGAYSFTAITLPTGVAATISRPTFTMLPGGNRVVITGMLEPSIVITEDLVANILGIAAPTQAPTLAAGGGTGLTGAYIGYYTYAHKIGPLLVAESSPSPGSVTLNLVNQNRVWTGLPTTPDNPRVTHLRLYVSIAGAVGRFITEFAIGISTTTEAISDASVLEEVSVRRGVPPYTYYAEAYHDRVYYAGDPTHPERIWFSELNEPESVYVLNYINTHGGEAVTGLKSVRGELLIFTRNATYMLTGFDNDDLTLVKISPVIGCIASHSIINVNEVLFFASEQGKYSYDGEFHYIMDDLMDYWRDDYNLSPALYQDAISVDDRENSCTHMLIPKATGFRYVAYYLPMNNAASQPWYSIFKRTRKDYTVGILGGALCTGSDDGYIRQENVTSNTTDDSDALLKRITIQTRHELGDDVGEEERYGKRWTDLDFFVESDNTAWTLSGYTGMEAAFGATTAYGATVPASLATGFTAKSHHHFRPIRLTGTGVTLRIQVSSPSGFKFRGFGADFTSGIEARPRV